VSNFKGFYLLFIRKDNPSKLKYGKRWEKFFPAGWYVYVGSGMKHMEKRVDRHFRKNKRKKWHIDFLLEKACLEFAFLFNCGERGECEVSNLLGERFRVVENFGATDCKCRGHLFYISELKCF